MRGLVKTALSAACAAILLALPARAETTKIAIGYGFTSDTLSAFMAKEAGIFEKHGLDATLTPVNGASNLMAGLFAGSMQFIMSNQTQLLTGVNGGLDLMEVAGGARTTVANDPIGLVMRPGVKYSEPADLVGKKIAVAGFDSGTYMLLRAWLVMKHVDAKQVDFVEGGMPNMGDLLKSEKVDGVTTVEPFLSKMVNDGVGRLVAKYYTEVLPDQPAIFWVSTRQYVAAHPDVVKAFRESLKEGAVYIHAHPDEARAVEKKVFGSNKPNLPNSNDTVSPADLEAYLKIGTDLGLYDKPIDVSKLIYHE
jgi:NitT/TauT family transport system substrate-binding protein